MHSYFDHLVLLTVSFAIGTLFAYTWQHADDDKTLLIQSAVGAQEINLNLNGIYPVKGTLGNSDIEIKNRTARFASSDCAHKICMQRGWLNNWQPIIACVPNAISIQISNIASSQNVLSEHTLDAYSY